MVVPFKVAILTIVVVGDTYLVSGTVLLACLLYLGSVDVYWS